MTLLLGGYPLSSGDISPVDSVGWLETMSDSEEDGYDVWSGPLFPV
jgi:hypothetical protein